MFYFASIKILRILNLYSDSDNFHIEVLGKSNSTGFCFYFTYGLCTLCNCQVFIMSTYMADLNL